MTDWGIKPEDGVLILHFRLNDLLCDGIFRLRNIEGGNDTGKKEPNGRFNEVVSGTESK